ncbi:MAG: helical backbone metal receptor [Candidatus Wallbacteria bacterium]|nr:helical backbone metal receptor [Candidatus Wallbacteria bacterium]
MKIPLLFLILTTLFLSASPRVVSLAPSITETIAFIGAEDCLVGVTTHCVYPERALKLPKIGGYQGINYERIMLLKPDLVIGIPAIHDAQEKFSRLGLNYFEIKQDNIDDIFKSVLKLGRLLDRREQAELKLLEMKNEIRELAVKSRSSSKVLLVIGNLPGELKDIYLAGPDCFLGELLSRLGYINAYEGNIEYPKVSVEQILKSSPERIIILSEKNNLSDQETAALCAPWKSLKLKHSFQVDVLHGEEVFIPGPRLLTTMKKLQKILESNAAGQ